MDSEFDYIKVETLGKGTYGSVIGVQDRNKEIHALKIIPSVLPVVLV
jgi:hypothetical protein